MAKAVDAEFGVETFALSNPALTVTSPTPYQQFSIANKTATLAVDFKFTVANVTSGGARCYLDGAFAEGAKLNAAGTTVFTFPAVKLGLHTLSCVLTNDQGVEYTNPEARGSLMIKVNPPCSVNADCADGNACSQDQCAYGVCSYGAIGFCCGSKFDCAAGELCLNPNTTTSQCASCQKDTDCNDNDSCTTDQCDLTGAKGVCKNTKTDPECCSATTDPCNDFKSCTVDSCNVLTKTCQHVQPAGVCCASSECKSTDSCKVGSCIDNECRYAIDQTKPNCCTSDAGCNDKSVCTDDLCNSPQPGGWKACTFTLKTDPATGQPIKDCCDPNAINANGQCDDGQPCTLDYCDGSTCVHKPIPGCCVGSVDCDDNSPCTIDKCNKSTPDALAGSCEYGKIPGCCTKAEDCNDNLFCTNDTCNVQTLTCVNTQTKNADGSPCCDLKTDCDDGKFCTAKACVNHQCAFGQDATKPNCCDSNQNCNDGKPCTNDSCDVAAHQCNFVSNGDPTCCNNQLDCNDYDCTTLDFCDATNHCQYKPAAGTCKADLDCDDGLACTTDKCTVVDGCGTCESTPTAGCCTSDLQCDDSNPMFVNPVNPNANCTVDKCVNGKCEYTSAAGCCTDDKDALTACDDKNACTVDYCLNNSCKHSAPKNGCCASDLDCQDGDKCTTDKCGAIGAGGTGTCAFTKITGCQCSQAGVLAGTDCNDNNPCTTDGCDSTGNCKYTAVAGCCIDKFDCDDGKPCTADTCVANTCLYFDAVGGQSVCCNPATEAVDCADKNSDCTQGKCLPQPDGTLACEAVKKEACTVNLNYCQDFSSSKDLAAMGWNPTNAFGSAAGNWGVNNTGGLGPDQYARLGWTPSKTNYETCLASPIFQAAGASTLSIQYDREFLPNGAGSPNTAIMLKGGLDGVNTDWSKALTIDTQLGNQAIGPDNVVFNIPTELSNSNGLRLAFCVAGKSTYDITQFAVDNVCVVKGSAPSFTKCAPNQNLSLGQKAFIPLKATDSDDSDVLSFSIVNGPKFVSLTSSLYYWLDNSWNSTLVISPLEPADIGTHTVTIKVSDGWLYQLCTFQVSVLYQGGVLIWKPAEVPDVSALKTAITKQGKLAQVVTDLSLYPDLTKKCPGAPTNGMCFEAIFVSLGVYPDNHVLLESEALPLKQYLAGGGRMYFEGGDTWAFDPPTSLHNFFKVTGVLDAAPNGVTGPLKGYTSLFAEMSTVPPTNFTWGYSQDFAWNSLNDQIAGINTIKKTRDVLQNDGAEKFIVAVGHDDVAAGYRTVASSILFGGISAGSQTTDKMMAQIFPFFQNGFMDCKNDGACDDGNACTTDKCVAGECVNDNTCLCAASTTLSCDQAVTKHVTNSGDSTNSAISYSCLPGNFAGKEHSYKYTSPTSKPVQVVMSNISNPKAQLFILKATAKGCDPTGCVAAGKVNADGTQTANFAAGAGETYFITVDVPDAGDSAQYDLKITCSTGEDCANGVDDNANNLIDCLDTASCCGDKACQIEICNGIDDNCDGQVDENCDKDGDGWCDVAAQTVGKPPICPSGTGDCNDQDGTVNPGTNEVCGNKKDDNCNGVQDEENASGCTNYYTDLDSDLYGTGNAKCYCAPSGAFKATKSGDCDDANINQNPGMQESCETAFDDNCDGSTNDVNALKCLNFYTDTDDDGFGTTPFKCMCVAAGLIKVNKSGDCADTNAAVNPGSTELCNAIDDNCDGTTDEGCDDDNDGYCDANLTYVAPPTPPVCPQGPGDTDDTDPKINPAGTEICDGKDNDSDLKVDEGCDDDADGYCDAGMFTVGKPASCPKGGGDCDDLAKPINPGVQEDCSTEVDDNCNGSNNDLGALECTPFFFDADADKWGTTSSKCFCVPVGQYAAVNPGDCNDDVAAINPAVAEKCDNVDNNCDGTVDEKCDGDGDGYCAAGAVLVGTPKVCPSGGDDCDDTDPTVNPSQAEVCGNGKDDNCNGSQNDLGAIGCTNFYADTDGDTFGLDTSKKCLCVPQGAFSSTTGGDCDDGDKGINPGATEACNAKDDNCDGQTDEICDKDKDGVCDASLITASPPPPVCPLGPGDCNDNDPSIFKGKNQEVCDGADDDCNGVVDNGCDDDLDGFCDAGLTASNPPPQICPKGAGDCDDTDNTVYPGAPEVCNNAKDDNCNGSQNDINALGCKSYFFDSDKDQYGLNMALCLCAPTGNYVAGQKGDCDDSSNLVKPGATELCNGLDDNCDAVIDEAGASGCEKLFLDQDKDGYGLDLSKCLCVAADGYEAKVAGDCNDSDAAVSPGKAEVCDDKDNNCNTGVDESCNKDGDSFCDAKMTVIGTPGVCTLGGGDCVDTDASISPVGNEICDGQDNNCNGQVDEGCDKDGDGYCDADMTTKGKPAGCPNGGGDCNDGDKNVNPGQKELCSTATVDDDCSGSTNDADADGCQQFYPDFDGDTFGKGGTAFQKALINEFRRNSAALTGAGGNEYIEVLITADMSVSELANFYIGDSSSTGAAKFAAYQLDLSKLNISKLSAGTIVVIGGTGAFTQDTSYNPASGDWNLQLLADGAYVKNVNVGNTGDLVASDVVWIDTSASGTSSIDSVRWGSATGALGTAAKVALTLAPTNGTTGVVSFIGNITSLNKAGSYQQEGAASIGQPNGGANTTFVNFLRAVTLGGDTKCLCVADANYKTTQGGDCNDNNNLIYSGALEVCDNLDNNCNGVVDEGCDKDGDGYCDSGIITVGAPPICPQGGGDCNDGDKTVNPGAAESCTSGKDMNCDGTVGGIGAAGCNTYYYDGDGDSFGVNVTQCSCGPLDKFTATKAGDCDDTKGAVNPNAAENCATPEDDNCNGTFNDVNAVGCLPFYGDVDLDGYGTGAATCLCVAQGNAVAPAAGDCNDNNKLVNPGQVELCDGQDNNCNGLLASTDQSNPGTGSSDSLTNWVAQEVVVGAAGTFDSVDVWLRLESGTTFTQTITVSVYADQHPGVAGAVLKETISGQVTVGANFQKYTFKTAAKPAFTAGQKMVLVFKASGTGLFAQVSSGDQYTPGKAWFNSASLTAAYGLLGSGATDLTFTTRMVSTGATVDEGCDDDGDKWCDANLVTVGKPAICPNGAGDCNDGAPTVNPATAEVCDNLDNNCSGATDEQCDADLDGYCTAAMVVVGSPAVCVKTTVVGGKGDDCDDANNQVYPGKSEICDDFDNNCDSQTDENCDKDGDKYCDAVKTVVGAPKSCPSGSGDCNDGNPAINPGAVEECDNIDNNCAAGTDEVCNDKDGDGFCNGNSGVSPGCPKGGGDCDDGQACADTDVACLNVAKGVNPGAAETCSTAYDDNCNGLVNEQNAAACANWYTDGDDDGFGGGVPQCWCFQTGSFTAPAGGDCNDSNAKVNPKAVDLCDGVDNDCNSTADDGCDDDNDLYCDNQKLVVFGAKCTKSPVPVSGAPAVIGDDCNDTAASANPGATELCDNLDNNCNLTVDEGCDDDKDLFCDGNMTVVGTPAACPSGNNDCNDTVATIQPGPTTIENCSTTADDNCDGALDGLNAIGCVNYYMDADNDGYGVTGNFECRCAPNGNYKALIPGDCNDADATANSVLAPETCDGKDNNCNGQIDETCDKDQDGYCDAGLNVLSTGGCPKTVIVGGKGDDCNDLSKSVNPGAAEWCDAVDNNCKNGVDENCDKDGDGFCDSNLTTIGAPAVCSKGGGDCKDDNPNINPAKQEVCNGADDNCNVLVDEAGATGCLTYYYDGDQDKVGISSSQCLCAPTGFYNANTAGDCDDTCPTCAVGKPELCDGKDNNCNGLVDEGCNADGDKYCTASMTTVGTPPICTGGGGDCNDNNASVFPTAQELCNNADDNCNGIVDENANFGCPLVANAVSKCVAGACVIASCSDGFYNLNTSYSDGCECNGGDLYEPNNTCQAAYLVSDALFDNGTKANLEARSVAPSDEDWYSFYASDLPDNGVSVCDKYNVRVQFLKNPGNLAFDISRGSCPNGVNNTVCCGQTDFNWFTNFKGTSGSTWSKKLSEFGECPCTTTGESGNVQGQVGPYFDKWSVGWNVRPGSPGGNGPYCMNYNSGYVCLPTGYYFTKCQDNSSWYYLRVYNTGGSSQTCGNYKLEFSNGLYGAPGQVGYVPK